MEIPPQVFCSCGQTSGDFSFCNLRNKGGSYSQEKREHENSGSMETKILISTKNRNMFNIFKEIKNNSKFELGTRDYQIQLDKYEKEPNRTSISKDILPLAWNLISGL